MEESIERVHTGIPGLDHVLEGGFPKGARVLLAGGAGCGKTICCGQYLYKGATRYGEPGVYVSTEEPPTEFRANMLRFGWDFKKLVEQLGATRLVVDSLPGFGFRVTDLNTLREIFLEVGLLLKDVGSTTLMTTEIVEGSGLISRYGIEEFLATGVMVLSLVKQSSPERKRLYVSLVDRVVEQPVQRVEKLFQERVSEGSSRLTVNGRSRVRIWLV